MIVSSVSGDQQYFLLHAPVEHCPSGWRASDVYFLRHFALRRDRLLAGLLLRAFAPRVAVSAGGGVSVDTGHFVFPLPRDGGTRAGPCVRGFGGGSASSGTAGERPLAPLDGCAWSGASARVEDRWEVRRRDSATCSDARATGRLAEKGGSCGPVARDGASASPRPPRPRTTGHCQFGPAIRPPGGGCGRPGDGTPAPALGPPSLGSLALRRWVRAAQVGLVHPGAHPRV